MQRHNHNDRRMLAVVAGFSLVMGLSAAPLALAAEGVTVHLTLKDHKFSPAESEVEANKPITIEVNNTDPTPAEFESKMLRVEKVVVGGGKIVLQVRPLGPGRYRFFDDNHQDTTEGFLVVK